MTISLQNQTIVVVGGAKRLGRAIALECARAGASVAISYRDSEVEARETVAEMRQIAPGAQFEAFSLEVSDGSAVTQFADKVFGRFENVRGLVNCAAIFERTPFESLTEADFDAHIAANLKGPFLLCRAFGAHFLRHGGGSIVNFSDIYAQRPLANYIPYCASKAGVEMLTKGFAKALAPGVRVNCIAPGTILLPSSSQGASQLDSDEEEKELVKRIPLGRLGSETEIAQTAVFLLGGPAFISGATLVVDGAQILR